MKQLTRLIRSSWIGNKSPDSTITLVIGLLFNYFFLAFIFLLLPCFGPFLYTAYVHMECPLFFGVFLF